MFPSSVPGRTLCSRGAEEAWFPSPVCCKPEVSGEIQPTKGACGLLLSEWLIGVSFLTLKILSVGWKGAHTGFPGLLGNWRTTCILEPGPDFWGRYGHVPHGLDHKKPP